MVVSGVIWGWFRISGRLSRVSGFSKVGLVIYSLSICGCFKVGYRMCVRLVCGLFGVVWVRLVYIGLFCVCLIGVFLGLFRVGLHMFSLEVV